MLLKVNNNIHTEKSWLITIPNTVTFHRSKISGLLKRPIDLRNLITSLITS